MAKLPSLIVTSTLLTASAAHAEELVVSPGLHLIVSFGAGFQVGLGLDLRVTEASVDEGGVHSGYGAFGQATWIVLDGLRLAAGLHAGVHDDGGGLDVELGWAFRWLDGVGAHGLQLGFVLPSRPIEVLARGTIAFAAEGSIVEGHFGLGGRLYGMFGEETLHNIKGRPYRVDGDKRFGPVAFGPRRHLGTGDTRWLDDAREEAASVPAFMTLARDLDRLGAPRLAHRARVAAREEVTHARLCNALATRDLGRRVRALPPSLVPTDTDLTRLVLESWQDGCVGEGTAAREASLEHATTRDPAARSALAQIAHDEAGHAELAWAVLAHLVPSAPPATRDALAHAITTTVAHDDVHATTLTRARRRAHRLNYY